MSQITFKRLPDTEEARGVFRLLVDGIPTVFTARPLDPSYQEQRPRLLWGLYRDGVDEPVATSGARSDLRDNESIILGG